jgi:endonuclease/exonuclease/phosphatase (EEP) superfamily protein YafD
MPDERDDDATDNFADQLLVVEDLVANNCDCHVIVGGDFNVDFSRDRLHTALLNSFCENLGLYAVTRHYKSTIDYSYNFNLDRFSILDHFVISSTIFDNLIDCA